MATPVPVTPAAPAPHVSWLKKFGHEVGVILGFVAKEGEPILATASTLAKSIDPAAAPLIDYVDGLATRILEQVKTTEAAYQAVGQGANGPAKLQAVVNASQAEIDEWVANNFPGAAKASAASKAGLVNAIVAVANDVDANLALVAPTSAATAAASAAVAAVAAAKTTA